MIYDGYLKLIRDLKKTGETINSFIIKDLIKTHKTESAKMSKWFNSYLAKDLPIFKRYFEDKNKINNQINNDFRGEIIDQCVGYLFGKPITYRLLKENFDNEVEYEKCYKYWINFFKKNNFENLDIETAKMMGICGYGVRLCYIDKDGDERIMNLNPWETILIYDGSIDEVQYALRYYPITEITMDGKRKTKYKVEWYDDKYITYFIQDNYGNYILDPDEPKNPQEHLFDKVPIIEFPNNNERLNDFYKVENLIDAYDRVISDVQNEIEEFRQAYLKFTGAEIDAETISKARQTGAFSLPDGADAEYLVKNINSEFIEKHKKELRDNIFRFSKTIDTNSETFTGAGASGEARKWIMTALEFKASIKEMKFRKSLYEMFSVLSTAWKKKGINITANDIQITFDRNFPQELKLEAEILEKLMGRISTRTALELFSPVRDVDAEIKRIQEEKEGLIDLDKIKIEEV